MALELSQRLVQSEAVPKKAIEAALLRHLREDIPFALALVDLHPQYATALQQELLQSCGPIADDIAADPQLMARLPVGLCTRLLGFPIGVTGSSGVVDVLAIDPLDRHILSEFGYHLKAPIRLLRGRFEHVIDQLIAVEGLLGPRTARQDQLRMNEAMPPGALSAPPIPLTRLAPEPPEPGTYRGVAPQAFVATDQRFRSPPAVRVGLEGRAVYSEPEREERPQQSSRVSVLVPNSDELQSALSELAVAEDPNAVVDALILGLSRVAREVIVFAVRGGEFRSRARSDQRGQPQKDAQIEVKAGEHALSWALEQGQYLGPPSPSGPEERFLMRPYDEVCVTRIDVSSRPALMIYAANFDSAYDASLRSDHLGRAASDALSRIVLAKKR